MAPQLRYYDYEALPTVPSIRLATIHPGKPMDAVELTLRTFRLEIDNPPPYEALSYVWGSEQDPHAISVGSSTNRGILRVTHNLLDALRHLRIENHSRLVWVDAVCINQADDSEKGPQVAMMGKIYRLASRVVVWLGPTSNDSDLAMDTMGDIGQQVEVDFEHYTMIPSDKADHGRMSDRNMEIPYGRQQLNALYHLMSRPWFERLWVRQEIFLASSAVVQCGTKLIPWSIFRKAWYCLYAKPWPPFSLLPECTELMGNLYGFLHQPRSLSILDLREMVSRARCKDGRDRIYGLLEMLDAKERAALDIRPDYSKTVSEVFRDVTLGFLTYSADACIFTQCQYLPDNPRPSWVPNWQSSGESELFLPSASRASGLLAAYWTQPTPGLLKIAGISIGSVKHMVGHDVVSSSTCEHIAAEIYRLVSQVRPLSDTVAQHLSFLTSFTRTLFLDRFSELYTPPGGFPSLADSLRLVEKLASASGDNEVIKQIAAESTAALTRCRFYLQGNKFLVTDDGSLAIGPASSDLGDRICVLLGCDRPMLLRPDPEGSYLVVGACFLSHVQFGEAILGPIPASFQPQRRWDVQVNDWKDGFYCLASGEFILEDPRLKNFGSGLKQRYEKLPKSLRNTVRVQPDVLVELGLKVEHFILS